MYRHNVGTGAGKAKQMRGDRVAAISEPDPGKVRSTPATLSLNTGDKGRHCWGKS